MRDEFLLLVIMEVIEMKISNDFDKLYKVVSEDDLSDVVGGKRKLPGWVKWVNGIVVIRFYFLHEISRSVLPSLTSFRISSPKRVFCQANQGRV